MIAHTNCTCPVCAPDLWASGIKGGKAMNPHAQKAAEEIEASPTCIYQQVISPMETRATLHIEEVIPIISRAIEESTAELKTENAQLREVLAEAIAHLEETRECPTCHPIHSCPTLVAIKARAALAGKGNNDPQAD